MGTYTDADNGYTENQIEFVDKDAISAKCFTAHTECSNSDFDEEGLSVLPCDDTTVVSAKGQREANGRHLGQVYRKYFESLSPLHRRLGAIVQSHPEPDFHPQRAFPDHHHHRHSLARGGSSVMSFSLWAALCAAAAVMALAVAFYRNRTPKVEKWNEAFGLEAERRPLISLK